MTFIPAAQVTAAFAKGAVLVNDGAYLVHASRREDAGQVEVHVKDTDIIYMLEGTTIRQRHSCAPEASISIGGRGCTRAARQAGAAHADTR